MMPLWLSIVLAIIPIGLSVITLVYTIHKDRVNKSRQQILEEKQAELQNRQSDVEAIAQYRHVKAVERENKRDLIVLVKAIQKESDDAESLFLYAYSSFTDLYNEVNAFCSLINHNSIVAEEVLKNTGIDFLLKMAYYQCESYEKLRNAAEKIGVQKALFKRPDTNAFIEYDGFLKKRMNKDRWETLVQKRKDIGLTC